MVERARQGAVAPGAVLEEERDHFLVGRAVKHLALVTIGETQHLRAVGVVTAGLAPQVGRLDGGHQQLARARAILLLPDAGLDALKHLQAKRTPGIDAGRSLADQAGADDTHMSDDLAVGWRSLCYGREKAG